MRKLYKIRSYYKDGTYKDKYKIKTKGRSAEITLNDVFVVHGIKIVKDKEKLIVKMPYRNSKTGREEEIVKPKTRHFRKYINQAILEAYQKEISA